MSKSRTEKHQQTAVDDVRAVRNAIAAQHNGNLHKHMAETNRIFEELKDKLGLKLVRHDVSPRKRRKTS